jgi:hypothetical protein
LSLLSAKYSNSPTLLLTIADSRIRRCLHALFCLCVAYVLLLLLSGTYALLAWLLLPPGIYLLRQARHEPLTGAVVCWQQGNWSVAKDGVEQAVAISRRSAALSWVIFLAWSEPGSGQRRSVWLFADSAPLQQLRVLRVRLRLEH